jgi:nucleotide-binding universal stress UspA family protein
MKKILVAYDGSECAKAAIENLKRAGLPPRAEALVLSLADVWPPPPVDVEGTPSRVIEMQEAARMTLARAVKTSEEGATRVRAIFPDWTVTNEAAADSPAWGILNCADRWGADLIVVGSHGMSAIDRLFIGSVSQRVMAHASGTVRVARPGSQPENRAIHVIVGFDGSVDADAALREVSSRSWPADTEIHIVTAIDLRMVSAVATKVVGSKHEDESAATHSGEYISKMAEAAAGKMRAGGVRVTSHVVEGEPKRVLTDMAEQLAADAIFVGATGLRGMRRLLLGSVSSAVTAHAPCTVEVVRNRAD